jgi:hypothetical protein
MTDTSSIVLITAEPSNTDGVRIDMNYPRCWSVNLMDPQAQCYFTTVNLR